MKTIFQKTAGFTLIELMVVVALIAIVLGLAAPSFQKTIAQQKLSTAASELLVSVMTARSEAIKNNQQTAVSPLVADNWAKGWQIYIDVNRNRTFESNTDTLISTVEALDTSILQESVSFANALNPVFAYTPSGFNVSNNAGTVKFKSSIIPSSELVKGVSISVSGRARICTIKPDLSDCNNR